MTPKPAEIFFSYSHKDEPFRKQLETHLSMLCRQELIKPWHDRMITAGDEWKGQIDDNLNSADIVLLLVTANFLASDYCYDIEMKRAMERHEVGEARVIPIILTPVEGWMYSPFAKLQVLPKDGKPVTKWDDRDEAFVNVAQGIRKAIDSGESASSNVSAVYPSSGFTAEALSTSSSITIQQFVGNQATLNDQLAFFNQQIGLVSPRHDYTKSQFKAYCNIWKSLQALRLAGNNLWERASKENLVKFSNQLRDTTQLAHEESIFFEESDYSELRSVLEEFECFHIGKERLIDIRSTQDFEKQEKLFSPHKLQKNIYQQIKENERHKVQYERVLDRIRVSFRQKLSSAA